MARENKSTDTKGLGGHLKEFRQKRAAFVYRRIVRVAEELNTGEKSRMGLTLKLLAWEAIAEVFGYKKYNEAEKIGILKAKGEYTLGIRRGIKQSSAAMPLDHNQKDEEQLSLAN